jgi:hypothetical protein
MPRLRIVCPHCKKTLAPRFLQSAVGKLNNSLHTPTGKPKVKKPCKYCGRKDLGARELREHLPDCEMNPKNLRE